MFTTRHPTNAAVDMVATPQFRQMFVNRVLTLGEGIESTRSTMKRLIGCTNPIFEAKLTKGMRILWSRIVRDGKTCIFVWDVCKHDFITTRMEAADGQIDKSGSVIEASFARMNKQREDFSIEAKGDDLVLGEKTVLVDPTG